jgi:hypothetical protein
MKFAVFWDVTPRSLVKICETTSHFIPEDKNPQGLYSVTVVSIAVP